MGVYYPTIGPIYPVANNNSLLNFTFVYPMNYVFDNLFVRFTIYDFIGNGSSNYQMYPFSWVNFTNSNVSLPWVVPPIVLHPGDYIIACFEWVQTNNNSQLIEDTNDCVLTGTSVNSGLLSIANPMTSVAVVTTTSANISAYYPAVLPYDQVNISATLNKTILPSMIYSTPNTTYSYINTFSFMNLTSNTYYNMCIYFNYANSKINGTQMMISQCEIIMTLNGTQTMNSTWQTTMMNSTWQTTKTVNGTPSNKVISKLTIIILFFIFAFI
jgi:hypothetical protein